MLNDCHGRKARAVGTARVGITTAVLALLFAGCTSSDSPPGGDDVRYTVAKSGTGDGSVTGGGFSCGTGCTSQTLDVQRDVAFDLVAAAAAASRFMGWTGSTCLHGGTNLTVTVTPAAGETCDARFDADGGGGGSGLQLVSKLELPFRAEGLAVRSGWAYTADYEDVAVIRSMDFSTATAPVFGPTLMCGYRPRNVAIFRDKTAGLTFLKSSSIEGTSCRPLLPLGSGATQLELGGGAGHLKQIAANLKVEARFEGRVFFTTTELAQAVVAQVALSTGRSCPISLDGNDSTVVVVGREGVAGTSTENCNNERKAFILQRSGTDWAVTAALELGGKPRSAALTPDGRYAYVSNFELNLVHRIDLQTRALAGGIDVDSPVGLDVDPSGNYLAVTSFSLNGVGVYSTADWSRLDYASSGGGQPTAVHWLRDEVVPGSRDFIVQNFQDPGRPGGSTAYFRFQYQF